MMSLQLACSADAGGESAPVKASAAQQAESCSTAPAQYDNAHPPPPGASTETSSLPACEARCGESPLFSPLLGTSWAYSSLPSGACSAAVRCQMYVSYTQMCGADTHACDLSSVVCDCEGGEWRCWTVAEGAGSCLPCESR